MFRLSRPLRSQGVRVSVLASHLLWCCGAAILPKRMTARNFDRVPPFRKQQSSKLPIPLPLLRAVMAELHDNLASLRGLYQDLSAISDSSFLNVERLVIELETHIQDFQKLLDKPAKSNASRQTVLSGR